jgi:hypothetical protein
MRTPIGRDDASVVIDLVEHGHPSRPLRDLQQVVVVDPGNHGQSLLAHEDPTFLQRPVFVAIEFVSLVFRGEVGVSLCRLRKGGRNNALRPDVPLKHTLHQFGVLLFGIELLGSETLWPFERCQGGVVPYSLQVRLAVGCTRWSPSLCCRGRFRGGQWPLSNDGRLRKQKDDDHGGQSG